MIIKAKNNSVIYNYILSCDFYENLTTKVHIIEKKARFTEGTNQKISLP